MTAVHRARRGPDRETAVRPLDPCLTGLASGTMPQAAEAFSLYRALGPASNPGLPTGFPPGSQPAPGVCPQIVGQLRVVRKAVFVGGASAPTSRLRWRKDRGGSCSVNSQPPVLDDAEGRGESRSYQTSIPL